MPAIMSGFRSFFRVTPNAEVRERTDGCEFIYLPSTAKGQADIQKYADLSQLVVTVQGYVVYDVATTPDYFTKVYTSAQDATAALHDMIAAADREIEAARNQASAPEPEPPAPVQPPKKPYAGKQR
ncbi:hypothetical protein RCDURKIN_87 [Rhodobacter phage RcDurkin]|nr:hypothetical protein RCDURKIN_87 [Rhodobacter phage RcDurkin]